MKRIREYQSKTSLNLAYKEVSMGNNLKIVIPIALIVAVLVGAFMKFMIFDKLNEAKQATAQVNAVKMATSLLKEENKAFDEMQYEYGRFSNSTYTIEELALVDVMEILELVDGRIMNQADMKSYSYNSNILNVVLTDITLKEVSSLVVGLYESDIVASVTVSTATTGDGNKVNPDQKVTANITVTVQIPNETVEGGAAQ